MPVARAQRLPFRSPPSLNFHLIFILGSRRHRKVRVVNDSSVRIDSNGSKGERVKPEKKLKTVREMSNERRVMQWFFEGIDVAPDTRYRIESLPFARNTTTVGIR